MMTREIQLHIHALAQLLTQTKSDFPSFRDFNVYKKNRFRRIVISF